MRPEAKVGLIIFASIVILVLVYWFLGGLALQAAGYPLYAEFANVQTLSTGSAVRMAGVRIGSVEGIILTDEKLARVTMRIRRGYQVPIESEAMVTTGGLIGEPYVEITPGDGPGFYEPEDTVGARDLVRFDELLHQVGGLVEDLRVATTGIREFLDDPEIAEGIRLTMQDLRAAADSIARAADDVRLIVAANRPEIASIVGNLEDASRRVAGLMDQLGLTLASIDIEDIPEILANARVASERLASAAAGVEDLATDPQLAEDIRVTAAEAREVAERTGRLIERVEEFVERVAERGLPSLPVPRPRPLGDRSLSVDLLANASKGGLRLDLNYDFTLLGIPGVVGDPGGFFRVGLFDVTDDAGLNLQRGMLLDNGSAFRYGLYASRLGIGYDWRRAANPSLHADLFGLNNPQLEVKTLYNLSPSWGVLLGVGDLFDERDVLIGARARW